MGRPNYTDQQKQQALDLYVRFGAAGAARQTGISSGTIKSWASRNNVQPLQRFATREQTRAAVEKRQQTYEEFRVATIERLKQVAELGLQETLERINSGELRGSTLVEAWSRAIAQIQLLSGEATERVEQVEGASIDREVERLEHELGLHPDRVDA